MSLTVRNYQGSPWLVLAVFALAMLVPCGFVLWLTNELIAKQTEASRLAVLDAHRGQLRLVRAKVGDYWRAYARTLDAGAPGRRFPALVQDEGLDGLIALAADGDVVFPDAISPRAQEADAIASSVTAIERDPDSASRAASLARLAAGLNDYSTALSAAQRLELMQRARGLSRNIPLPTEAALELSTSIAKRGVPRPPPGELRQTSVADVWALASETGLVLALFRTGRLEAMMHDLLHQVTPAGIRFLAFPPGMSAGPEAITAGAVLPGWQLAFQVIETNTSAAAGRRQTLTYLAGGLAALAAIAMAGAVAAQAVSRHLRLARLKTDLVSAVSHELRTPLASMRVLVDGLLDDPRPDPTKTKEYLALMARENARLTRLVENFLAFSRIERGRHRFLFATARPADIAAAALAAVRERMPADCEVRLDIEPDLPPLHVDADAVTTALINLVDNAVKYSAADRRIHLRVHREADDSIVFSVEDNGIGIAPRERRRIFHRFYRVDRRLARETDGVGLGLSIVDLIARAHGGSVDVRSEVGVGSTFVLRLPLGANASRT